MSEPSEQPALRRLLIHRSESDDVYENLAREEYLFDAATPDTVCFLLYVDGESVVMGKHQNPWREIDVGTARAKGVAIARRISGGGTVFHDRGNLNFSFILPRRLFDRRANLEVVVRALGRLGIPAEVSPRFDILAAGRKISGNAFCFHREMALHHGTLLVDARLDRLGPLLDGLQGAAGRSAGGSALIESYAVASRPAQVVNLKELQPALSPGRIALELKEEVERFYASPAGSTRGTGGPGPVSPIAVEELDGRFFAVERVRELRARNAEPAWLFDSTPRFVVDFRMEAAGRRRLHLTVEQGRVTAVESGLDGFAAELLIGTRFDAEELACAVEQGGSPESGSLAAWLRLLAF